MASRELVALGTASQVPTRHRNHNGYLLRWDATGILFDPGEGTQRQMTLEGISVGSIDRILITHFHGDHCLGLPGILQRLALERVAHRVDIHYPAAGQVFYDRLRHASAYHDTADIEPHPITAPGRIADGELLIDTRRLDHPVESWGYRIHERAGRSIVPARVANAGIAGAEIGRLRRDGMVRVGDRTVSFEEMSEVRRGQVVAFVMDTRRCANAVELARDADLLVCESTFAAADAELADRHGHLTTVEAAEIAVAAGARRLVLTHFSRRYPDIAPLLAEARAVHDDVIAAHDGLIVGLPPREPRPGTLD